MRQNKRITQKEILEEIIRNSFLIPEKTKIELCDNLDNDIIRSELLDFFNKYWDYEKEILSQINEEFPSITKKMLQYIESNALKDEKLEAVDSLGDINFI